MEASPSSCNEETCYIRLRFISLSFSTRSTMSRNQVPAASSATSGFFQALPTVNPLYSSPRLSSVTETQDCALARVLALHLPDPLPASLDRSLHDFARKCLSLETLRYGVDAELNPPRLNPLTTFGEENRNDALWTSEGWRALKAIGIEGGNVALGYANSSYATQQEWNRRIHQFAIVYLFTGSAALVTCPAAMTDGAAVLLSRHVLDADGDQPGRAKVLLAARDRLIQFDPKEAWTSGQWMTERTGGSDVSLTETVAHRLNEEKIALDEEAFGSGEDAAGMALGPWRVDGFKWFSSATDADMVVLLARTEKGISTFYAPMRRKTSTGSTVMNGVRIVRLKEKMGTKALPTAELEIKGMRAWLVGEEGRGVKEISAVLNTTRLWTAVGAVGGWGRGLAIARAYSRVRRVKNALLIENTQHVAWMAAETVKHRAACHLVFFGVALQGISEQGMPAMRRTRAEAIVPTAEGEAEILLRVLTPVMKAQCSLASVAGLRECMESLGGVGYCENNFDGGIMNVARIFRDTNVNCIWEGTTSIMAEDLVRALKGRTGNETIAALERLIRNFLDHCHTTFEKECGDVEALWTSLKQQVSLTDGAELLYNGRALLGRLEIVICACLLMYDANGGQDRISIEIAKRYLSITMDTTSTNQHDGWQKAATLDEEIFLGASQSQLRPMPML